MGFTVSGWIKLLKMCWITTCTIAACVVYVPSGFTTISLFPRADMDILYARACVTCFILLPSPHKTIAFRLQIIDD